MRTRAPSTSEPPPAVPRSLPRSGAAVPSHHSCSDHLFLFSVFISISRVLMTVSDQHRFSVPMSRLPRCLGIFGELGPSSSSWKSSSGSPDQPFTLLGIIRTSRVCQTRLSHPTRLA
ncbi:hypothetical protein CRG98_014321 [Punica granatum]|uniref:Uncharacterized protein n=1 Tax=Punica granatum TaxID=22663 RepID=A0A2I0KAX0_PUNGR|nr:hypothetical protein CRG98_014321 [Punica granatum]